MFPLGDHAFEILLTDELEELPAFLLKMIAIQYARWCLRDDAAQYLFSFQQRQVTKIAAIQPEQVEGIKARVGSAVQKIVELRAPVGIQANDFAVQHGIFNVEMAADPIAQLAEGFVGIAASRQHSSAFILNIGQATKSIVLDFKNPVGMAKSLVAPEQRHRLEEYR